MVRRVENADAGSVSDCRRRFSHTADNVYPGTEGSASYYEDAACPEFGVVGSDIRVSEMLNLLPLQHRALGTQSRSAPNTDRTA